MDELLSEFLTETAENISELDVELIQLEQDPNDQALLGNIFRLVHTIKGTCGFLGLPRLEAVAHASENVLGKVRDGSLEVSKDAITLIFESFDRIKWLLSSLEENEVEPDGDDQDLIDRLNLVADGGRLDGSVAPAAAGESAPSRSLKKSLRLLSRAKSASTSWSALFRKHPDQRMPFLKRLKRLMLKRHQLKRRRLKRPKSLIPMCQQRKRRLR